MKKCAASKWRVRLQLKGVAVLLSLCFVFSAQAQVSLVPTSHQIYEWLHHQRVRGNIDYYAYEALPLRREQIQELLVELQDKRSTLTRIDQQLLDAYRQEFHLVQDGTPPSIFRDGVGILSSGAEPHVYAYRDSVVNLTLDGLAGFAFDRVEDGDASFSSPLRIGGGRGYATLYNRLGLHWEGVEAATFADAEVLRYDPLFGQTFQVRRSGESASDILQTFLSYRHGVLSVHYARGANRYGPSAFDPLLLSDQSAFYDWFRFNVDFKRFRFVFVHGSFAAPARDEELEGFPGELTRVSDPRWFAMHRFEFQPSRKLQLAFSEIVTYSNRGIDPAYLHPFYIIRIAEFATDDKDNPMLMLDATWRPWSSVEFHTAFLLDDISYANLFKKTDQTTKFGFQAGGTLALRSGTDLLAEYTRISPFVYTHRFRLNNYEQQGVGLGHQLGPNGDQVSIGVRQWLPWRGKVGVTFRSIRKGLNVFDEAGELVENAGSDLLTGSNGFQQGGFPILIGDVHEWTEMEVNAAIEVVRGLRTELFFVQRGLSKGAQLEDRQRLSFRVLLGF